MSVREKGSIYNQPSVYNQGGGGGGGDSYLSKIPARVWLTDGYSNAEYGYDYIKCSENPGQSVNYSRRMGMTPIVDKITFGDLADSLEINVVIHVPSVGGWGSCYIIRNDNFYSPSNIRVYGWDVDRSNSRTSLYCMSNNNFEQMFLQTGFSVPDIINANIKFYKSGSDWKLKATLQNSVKCDRVIVPTGLDNEGLAPAFGYSRDMTSAGLPQSSYVSAGTYIKKDGVLIWGNEV